jgi:hypothetical protein
MARTYWTDERIDSAFGELRDEMRGLRTELSGEIGGLRSDMHREFTDLRRQALTAAVAVIVALMGVIGAILVSA